MKEVMAYCRHFLERLRQIRLGLESLHMLSVSYVVLR
jgi:hypothetical protein